MENIKFLLFGTGDYYERYKKWFRREDVLALLDNSPAKQNSMIDGIRVLSPAEGVKLSFDVIVILSFYVKAMRRQLMDLGVPDNKIYHFYDLHQLLYRKELKKPIQYYGDPEKVMKASNNSEERVLLLSQDLTFGGPAIALFHAARILVKHGYQVVYASMMDGPLREKLQADNIPVIVDVNLQIETMVEAGWIKDFALLICNTINFHVFLSGRDTAIPTMWWLHDSEFFYDGVRREVLDDIDRKNLWVCSVGPVPKNAVQKKTSDISVNNLLYGVEDEKKCNQRIQNKYEDKIYMGVIGYIEERKGQDILIKAIREMSEEYRKQTVFFLVGQDSSILAQRIKTETADLLEVVVTGPVDRAEIHNFLDNMDVLICPSREDPMPTVAAEAMMHSVPCIVSDVVGTATYIRNGENGFVFPNEDAQSLAERIEWCVGNKDRLGMIGKRARKLYEHYFSMPVFEKNLLRVVTDILRKVEKNDGFTERAF